MSAIDDPKTLGRARLSFADQHDIDEFIATLEKSERGEIGPDQWRAFRFVRGGCGQSQEDDVHMLRVKVPQGVLDARQLYAFATVADPALSGQRKRPPRLTAPLVCCAEPTEAQFGLLQSRRGEDI